MANKTGKQLEVELDSLLGKAGEAHYDRLKIADQLLQDKDWIAGNGQGSIDKALTYLEKRYFADLIGRLTLVGLLDVFHHTSLADWKRHHFDFNALWSEWKASQRPRPRPTKAGAAAPKSPSERVATPAEFKAMPQSRQESEHMRALALLAKAEKRIGELEQENAALKRENAALKSQLKAFRELANQKIA